MSPWIYPAALALASLLVFTLEVFLPARPTQRRWRARLLSDFVYLVFNGHFLGVLLSALALRFILPPLDGLLGRHGGIDLLYRNAAANWPLWLQIVVALIVVDFVQWTIHVSLHRVPWLWELHKVHHSVVDGEMDWIVSFRFHWLEVAVYKTGLYLPLAFFGFSSTALLVHAIFGTFIGHLNHANLDWGHGRWRYLFNSPRMHIWHHDAAATASTTVNFGIIFSTWDWIFGTAHMPGRPPEHLGFDGETALPRDFLGQEAWPLSRLLRAPLLASGLGLFLLGGAWLLGHLPKSAAATSLFGEEAAESQPNDDRHEYAASAGQATLALAAFGDEARRHGFARPEELVSVDELGAALSSPRLVVIDVRGRDGFEKGHIPSAQRMTRKDYSVEVPIPGLSRPAAELERALAERGVQKESVVVLYGDGGPEPFRLAWTLWQVGHYRVRLLDGGLGAWKGAGRRVAQGAPQPVAAGDVRLDPPAHAPLLWHDLEAESQGAQLLDTRSSGEYSGSVRHPEAARAGKIPGAQNLEWLAFLRDPAAGDTRLRPPALLRPLLAAAGLSTTGRVVTYCQTGTRSSVAWFALRQLGMSDAQVVNYNGSWAEYSRLGK